MSKQIDLNIGVLPIAGDVSAQFRPIHYLGSKLRLIEQIKAEVMRVRPRARTFCDLFSGSCTLSYAMAQRYDVTAVDVQEYSRVLASTLMGRVRPTTAEIGDFVRSVRTSDIFAVLSSCFADAIDFETKALQQAVHGETAGVVSILEDGSVRYGDNLESYTRSVKERLSGSDLSASEIFYSSVYGGIYFSYAQAVMIDVIRAQIEKLQEDGQRTFYLAALISTVSTAVNTIGKQFAQPIRLLHKDGRVKTKLISKVIADRSVDILSTYEDWLEKYSSLEIPVTSGKAIRDDYVAALEKLFRSGTKFDVIYADPPYTRDHYSRFYHLLETLALKDEPEISVTTVRGEKVSRGLYRQDRHQSAFCIKSQAPSAFAKLFEASVRFECPLLVSYSPFSRANDDHPRLMDIQQIVEIGRRYYGDVEVSVIDDFAHSKLNSTENNKLRVEHAEVLLTFLP